MDEKQKNLVRAYQKVFDTDDGQLILKDLEEFGYMRKMIDAKDENGRIDPIGSAINSGKRFIVLRIHSFLKQDLEEERQTHAR